MMNFVHFLRLNEKIDDIAFDPKNDPDLKFKDGELLVSVDSKSYRTYDEN
jgi:hypothetical protein